MKLAKTPEEAAETAPGRFSGMDIKGHIVHKVLVAPGADIAKEYLSRRHPRPRGARHH